MRFCQEEAAEQYKVDCESCWRRSRAGGGAVGYIESRVVGVDPG